MLVYERAARFKRVGAGIQQSPTRSRYCEGSASRRQCARGFLPAGCLHRDAGSGEVKNRIALGHEAEARCAAPYVALHRGDLRDVLRAGLPDRVVRTASRLVGLEAAGRGVDPVFADGTRDRADFVIGADGGAASLALLPAMLSGFATGYVRRRDRPAHAGHSAARRDCSADGRRPVVGAGPCGLWHVAFGALLAHGNGLNLVFTATASAAP